MVSGFLIIKIKSATKGLTMNATNTLASANFFEQTQVQRCYCLLNSLQMKYSSKEIYHNSNEYKIIVALAPKHLHTRNWITKTTVENCSPLRTQAGAFCVDSLCF